jgi:hypothetical protein
MKRAMTILAILSIACVYEDPADPAPLTDSADNGVDVAGDGTAAGETGDVPSCDPEYAEYECRGFMGCVYQSASGSTWKYFHPSTDSGSNLSTVECVEFGGNGFLEDEVSACGPYLEGMDLATPTGDIREMANALIMDVCEETCEADAQNYFDLLPATVNWNNNTWTKHHCECHFEFQPDGRGDDGVGSQNAVIPADYCDYITLSGDPQPDGDQIRIAGPCEDDPIDDECPVASCTGWDPLKWTAATSSCTGSAGRACATVDTDLWNGIFVDPFDLIECDAGRLRQHDSPSGGPAEWWDFGSLISGDFFYELGLRTNDKLVRVKIGSIWKPLTTDAEMQVAYEMLNSATDFTLEVQRGSALKQFWVKIQQCPDAGC